jgi:hypothetical protein
VAALKRQVGTLERTSLILKGGFKTLAILGTAISACMVAVYHVVMVFFPHKG